MVGGGVAHSGLGRGVGASVPALPHVDHVDHHVDLPFRPRQWGPGKGLGAHNRAMSIDGGLRPKFLVGTLAPGKLIRGATSWEAKRNR